MMEDVRVKLNLGLLWQKLHSTRRGLFFTSTLDLKLRKKLVKCYIWGIAYMVLKLGCFRQSIRNTWKVLKCGAGEGLRRSVGPIT